MDGTIATATNPISFVDVLFYPFSKLRRPEGHLRVNLDKSDYVYPRRPYAIMSRCCQNHDRSVR